MGWDCHNNAVLYHSNKIYIKICKRKAIRQRHLAVAVGNYGRHLETVQGLENSEERWGEITTTMQSYLTGIKYILKSAREKLSGRDILW
jgi:hypothetical protein